MHHVGVANGWRNLELLPRLRAHVLTGIRWRPRPLPVVAAAAATAGCRVVVVVVLLLLLKRRARVACKASACSSRARTPTRAGCSWTTRRALRRCSARGWCARCQTRAGCRSARRPRCTRARRRWCRRTAPRAPTRSSCAPARSISSFTRRAPPTAPAAASKARAGPRGELQMLGAIELPAERACELVQSVYAPFHRATGVRYHAISLCVGGTKCHAAHGGGRASVIVGGSSRPVAAAGALRSRGCRLAVAVAVPSAAWRAARWCPSRRRCRGRSRSSRAATST